MPDFLTLTHAVLTGGVPVVVPIREGAAEELEPLRSGEQVRQYDNSLRSSENPNDTKRVARFSTAPLDVAEFEPLYALLDTGAVLTVGGGWLAAHPGGGVNGAKFTPTVTGVEHIAHKDASAQHVIAFTLEQSLAYA